MQDHKGLKSRAVETAVSHHACQPDRHKQPSKPTSATLVTPTVHSALHIPHTDGHPVPTLQIHPEAGCKWEVLAHPKISPPIQKAPGPGSCFCAHSCATSSVPFWLIRISWVKGKEEQGPMQAAWCIKVGANASLPESWRPGSFLPKGDFFSQLHFGSLAPQMTGLNQHASSGPFHTQNMS